MKNPVTLSANATAQLKKLLKDEPEGSRLRVSVLGGGCSGFSYEFDFVQKINDDDIEIDSLVVIDQISLPYVLNAELDYVEELIGASFQMRNPNARSSCGCGVSFSI